MKINKVKLFNFRNYENEEVCFNDGLNVLIGNNAQGKTNLVEAINFCSIGKSHRTSKDKELIRFNQDQCKIFVELQKIEGKKTIEIILSNSLKKIVKINGLSILRIGELMENLNCIFFSPNDLKLVKEMPEERRRFIDIDLSQMSKIYFYNLLKYDKILSQRNKLLKESFDKIQAERTIFVWDEQLSDIGSKIISKRIEFIKELSIIAKKIHYKLTDNKEELKLFYSGLNDENIPLLKAQLLDYFKKNLEKDVNLGYTSFGPHRDDIKITCNDIDIRNYGSQGQQRTVALSLKLAELEIFKNVTNQYPILILDDVLSELDNSRAEVLLNSIQNVQTLLTCTTFEHNIKCTKYKIENGHCKKI